jgi:hypothetical protein
MDYYSQQQGTDGGGSVSMAGVVGGTCTYMAGCKELSNDKCIGMQTDIGSAKTTIIRATA